MTPADLLVLGEVNLDLVVDCGSAEIAFGQVETLVDDATLTLGSSGCITAAAAAAQGCRVAIAGVVGDDAMGAMARRRLDELGVDTTGLVTRAGLRTGITVVLNRPGGDRAMLTYPGAMTALTGDLVDPSLLAAARHLHVSSPFLQTSLQPDLHDLLGGARSRGATTSIDPGWDPADDWSVVRTLMDVTDYLLPNGAECLRLAATHGDLGSAARALAAQGPTVVVKLGADGGILVNERETISVAAHAVVPVDTTGAGDNFDAGFLVGLVERVAPEETLARAVAAGSIAVGGVGGTGRLGSRRDVIAAAGRLARSRFLHAPVHAAARSVEGNS